MVEFDNSFAREMAGFYEPVALSKAPAPQMVIWNEALGADLGLGALRDDAEIWSGSLLPQGAKPIALAYAGHQFGGFSPRLGDGRATLLGEVLDAQGHQFDVQWKGSGLTPFSRAGTDGKCALGPALREYVLSEAMHALGVPTTRGLAVALTGEKLFRNGMKSGAVFTRVASGHIRVGSFEYFAALRAEDKLRQLADYAMERFYPDLPAGDYLAFLRAVIARQAELVAHWMSLGFVHGVMNTDNMSIAGETIDYGPCAFMEAYDARTVFSSIDQNGRYAYGRQPQMAQWNLARFAEAILPLLDADLDKAVGLAERAIGEFVDLYLKHWLDKMALKIGVLNPCMDDAELVNEFLEILKNEHIDFTLGFRHLSDENRLRSLFVDQECLGDWLGKWKARNGTPDRELLNRVNPIYIPRNQRIEEAIASAENDNDFIKIYKLVEVIKKPFEEQSAWEIYTQPASDDFGAYVTFCGT